MSRPRLTLALVLAILLIGGAVWKRAEGSKNPTKANLATIDNSGNVVITNQDVANADLNAGLADLTASNNTSTGSSTNLTDTDLISRQLFSDYLNLSLSGQNTPANITTLGNTYADNIAQLDKATSISLADLSIVLDNKTNFQTYADSFSHIYFKYRDLLALALANNKVASVGPQFSSLTTNMSNIYQREATDLEALPVPTALADAHLQLVNIYLDNAWAMQAISNGETDPTAAFAGMVAENSNLTKEKDTLDNIQKILTDNGI